MNVLCGGRLESGGAATSSSGGNGAGPGGDGAFGDWWKGPLNLSLPFAPRPSGFIEARQDCDCVNPKPWTGTGCATECQGWAQIGEDGNILSSICLLSASAMGSADMNDGEACLEHCKRSCAVPKAMHSSHFLSSQSLSSLW